VVEGTGLERGSVKNTIHVRKQTVKLSKRLHEVFWCTAVTSHPSRASDNSPFFG